jgi:hypothetical protein
MSTHQGEGSSTVESPRSETERAERFVEEWAERIGGWASRAAARAQEEAEDIWAEAQNIRREE